VGWGGANNKSKSIKPHGSSTKAQGNQIVNNGDFTSAGGRIKVNGGS
jgi:hypothetical protein